jgi:hypothetical protein
MCGRLAHPGTVADVLDVNKFFGALELFCDPSAPGGQFPTDQDDAKNKWGAAWQLYFNDLTPLPPLSANAAPAFIATLALGPSLGVPDTSHDLAKAWRAAMDAVLTFDGMDVREAGLRLGLAALFASPSLLAAQRVKAIADVFAAAMVALTSAGGTITYA